MIDIFPIFDQEVAKDERALRPGNYYIVTEEDANHWEKGDHSGARFDLCTMYGHIHQQSRMVRFATYNSASAEFKTGFITVSNVPWLLLTISGRSGARTHEFRDAVRHRDRRCVMTG